MVKPMSNAQQPMPQADAAGGGLVQMFVALSHHVDSARMLNNIIDHSIYKAVPDPRLLALFLVSAGLLSSGQA